MARSPTTDRESHTSNGSQDSLRKQLEQVPPFSEIHEKYVLGAMMIDPRAAKAAISILKQDDFYLPRHRNMFSVLSDMFQHNCPLDEGSITETLKRRGKTGSVSENWPTYIMDCPTAGNVEAYCEIVRQKALERAALEAVGQVLKAIHQPTERSTAQILSDAETSITALRRKAQTQTTENWVEEIRQQFIDERDGKRVNIQIPRCPCLDTVQALIPDSRTLIVGPEGTSKSFWVDEWTWRWARACVPVSLLALEKRRAFNARRMLAQMAEESRLLNLGWCQANDNLTKAAQDEWQWLLEYMRTNETIQAGPVNETCDAKYLIRWIKGECDRGRKVLLIDPITKMRSSNGRNSWDEPKNFVDATDKLCTEYQIRLILVTHPKDVPPGTKLLPCKNNIGGVMDLRRFFDTILWLDQHAGETREVIEEQGCNGRLPAEHYVNRTLWLLKTRNEGRYHERIGYELKRETLCHEEKGWLADDEDKKP